MDKSEKETHDFMNVESFSQLPFIRPAPPPQSTSLKEKGIRLFGKEFGGVDAATATAASAITAGDESESGETNTCEETKQDQNNENNNGGSDCGRRFECHYCCRNFPTSQALGGHQNAHKRERQHAKRAHLQSAMVHTASSFSADAHMYGALMNYRLAGSPPTWNNNSNSNNGNNINTTRYYGSQYGSFSHHHHQPPINGSPLALWRIPTATHNTLPSNTTTSTTFNRDRLMHHSPLFSGDHEMMKPSYGVHGGGSGGGGSSSSQSSRYIYETKPSVQDHRPGEGWNRSRVGRIFKSLARKKGGVFS